jgi:hypothetical protein
MNSPKIRVAILDDSGGSGKLDKKVFFLSEALPG